MESVLGDLPKILAPLGGHSLLENLLEFLVKSGVSNCYLAVGHLADQINKYLHNIPMTDMEIHLLKEPDIMGTAGATSFAFEVFEDDRALVLNGDTFFQIDLTSLVEAHIRQNADATIVVRHVPDRRRFGSVSTGTDGRVTGFIEKGEDGPGFVNAGTYVLERSFITDVSAPPPVSLENDVIPNRLHQRVFSFEGQGLYLDVGTPEGYLESLSLMEGRNIYGES